MIKRKLAKSHFFISMLKPKIICSRDMLKSVRVRMYKHCLKVSKKVYIFLTCKEEVTIIFYTTTETALTRVIDFPLIVHLIPLFPLKSFLPYM